MSLDLWRRSSTIRENFVSDPQLSIDYGVTMDLQKKPFTESASSSSD